MIISCAAVCQLGDTRQACVLMSRAVLSMLQQITSKVSVACAILSLLRSPQHLVYPVLPKCAESARKWHRASRYGVCKNQKFEVALGISPQKARQASPGCKKAEKAEPNQPAVDGCQQAPRSSLCTHLRVLLSQGLFSLTRA